MRPMQPEEALRILRRALRKPPRVIARRLISEAAVELERFVTAAERTAAA